MKILKTPSPHFDERLADVDTLLIHYTDMTSATDALMWLINPLSKVSAHYLIDDEGHVHQLVEEDKRAWHAGESFWQGRTNINSCSIGIELTNPGHSHGHTPFPEAQVEALIRLSQGIRARWDIPPARVLGHSDVAPRRKQDPGHLFPWEDFAREGLGLWPKKVKADDNLHVETSLSQIGYEIVSPHHALLAFQRHFQPHKVDGVTDEETLSLLQGLLKAHQKSI
jgi:N-acetylmuramoyl-L-alanine amidase